MNTHVGSGLGEGSGGRAFAYLHVCATGELDDAKGYELVTVDMREIVRGKGLPAWAGKHAGHPLLDRATARSQMERSEAPARQSLRDVARRV